MLLPIPAVPQPRAEGTVPMGDLNSFPEMKLDDLPATPGPFEPTWESIEKNYPGEPAWLREAKFGIWIHVGPQSAGESGDWYARRLYLDTTANWNGNRKLMVSRSPVRRKCRSQRPLCLRSNEDFMTRVRPNLALQRFLLFIKKIRATIIIMSKDISR